MKRNPVLILVFSIVTSTWAMPWHKWKWKGTSRWSVPWRCQSASAAQKAQTPVLVNLPWTSPAFCDLELQASEAYPYAVAHFSKTQRWSSSPSGVHFGHTNTWQIAEKVEMFIRVVLPLTCLAVTVMVGGGSCRLEVRNNKRATARGSWFYFFVSFGWYMREVVVLPSRLLSLSFFFFFWWRLIVTSKSQHVTHT